MPSVAGDGQACANFDGSVRRIGVDPSHPVAGPDEIGRIGVHQDLKRGKALAALAQEIQKIPLRHHCNEGVFDAQTTKISDADGFIAKLAVQRLQLLMRHFQKAVDQAQFVHHLQGRGMHGVAAKIAKKSACFSSTTVSTPARPKR